jgi:hypothetical protein
MPHVVHSSTGGRSRAEPTPGARRRPAATDGPAGRTALVFAAVFVSFQRDQSGHPLLTALVLTALLVVCVLAVVGSLPRVPIDPRVTARLGQGLVTLAVLRAGIVEAGLDVSGPSWLSGLVVPIAVVAAVVAVWAPPSRLATGAFAALLAAQAFYLGLVIDATPYLDDVPLYVVNGLREAVHGRLPYGGSVANPFDAADTVRYLAPELVRDDRILIGFPYLPGVLVAELPGYLLGDYRITHLVSLVLLAVVWWRLAVDQVGRGLAVLAVLSPYTAQLVGGGWVEPPIMLGLGCTALAVARGWRVRGAVGLAFLLASKQYAAFVLPFVVPVWRRLGWRAVVAAALAAGVLDLAFFAWGPTAFWHDVVTTQLIQPYRPDSISLVVAVGNHTGVPPAWLLTLLPLVGGLGVSSLVSVRGRPGATATAAAMGLGLFAVLLLSKQAFFNYFAVVEAGLVTAAIAWSLDGPVRAGTPGDRPQS